MAKEKDMVKCTKLQVNGNLFVLSILQENGINNKLFKEVYVYFNIDGIL